MCDTIKSTKLLRDVMDEISKFIKYSPKWNAAFDELKERIAPDTPVQHPLSYKVDCACQKPEEC